MNIDLNKLLTTGRYAVTYAGGVITALGLSSTVDPNALQSGFDHVFNGIKEIAVGAGILMPIAATAWGIFEQTVGRLVTKLHATAPDQLANAVAQVSPGTLAKATASIEGVQVTVNSDARPSLRALAADPAQRDIVVAPPAVASSKKFQGL